jgi:hypothetical protein
MADYFISKLTREFRTSFTHTRNSVRYRTLGTRVAQSVKLRAGEPKSPLRL